MNETNKVLAIITGGAIVIFIIILLCMSFHIRHLNNEIDKYKNAPADTVVVTKIDTISVDRPVEKIKYISRTEYVNLTDTLVVYDTVLKIWKAPREYLVYQDTSYRAVVSGVDPRLDTLKIYRPTIYQTITKTVEVKKKTHWGIGVQAGYGYNGKKWSPYVGAGVSYNILSW